MEEKPKLKYNYKEDQWSPINMEGKKQYDREFLLQLQKDPKSLIKPADLPVMEIIRDKANVDNRNKLGGGPGSMSGPKDWTPGFVKPATSKSGRGDFTKRSQNGKGKDMRQPQMVLQLSIQEKIQLHETENAWKPAKLKQDENGGDLDPLADLAKKARGILNKLTPQKFDVLVERFNELEVNSEDALVKCMELVFEKAVDEPGFSVAYARMCEVLKKKQVLNKDGKPINFRSLLVSRCQKEFERDYLEGLDKEKYDKDIAEAPTEERKKELILEFEEKERLARRRSLGNIRFIGELYKLKMLTARIMHECVAKLIRACDEESLECLCRLLTTVGSDLEKETNDILNVSFKNEFY